MVTKLCSPGGPSVYQLAKKSGISLSSLHKWVHALGGGGRRAYIALRSLSATTYNFTNYYNLRLRVWAEYGYRTVDPFGDCDGLCVEVPTSYSDYIYSQ